MPPYSLSTPAEDSRYSPSNTAGAPLPHGRPKALVEGPSSGSLGCVWDFFSYAPFSSRLRILPSQLYQPLGMLAQFTEEIIVFHFISQLSRLRVTPGGAYILPFYSFLVAVMKCSDRRNVGEKGVLGLTVPGFSGGKVRASRAWSSRSHHVYGQKRATKQMQACAPLAHLLHFIQPWKQERLTVEGSFHLH